MAFKMNRPLKMAGPKKSVLKLGRAKNADSGLYYNSSMGPMKMHSPSALKQMEEEGAGMEEMMGMMGEMGGGAPPAEGPVEEAPVEKESEGTYEPDPDHLLHIEDMFLPEGDKPGTLHIASDEGDEASQAANTAGDAAGIEGLERDVTYKVVYADDYQEGDTEMYNWKLDKSTNTITLTAEAKQSELED